MTNSVRTFLDEVAAAMSLPADLHAEALQEVEAHLADAAAGLHAAGMDADEARAEAVRRLGSPHTLGLDLTAARRPRSRILAAAGAGAWAVLRAGLPTVLVAWVLLALIAAFLVLVFDAASHVAPVTRLVTNWNVNSVMGGVAIDIGALVAGSAAIRAVAAAAWRRPDEVRPLVMVAGSLLTGWLALAWVSWDQQLASVVSLVAAPLAFAVGTTRGVVPRPGWRATALTIGLTLVGLIGASGGTSTSGPGWSPDALMQSAGLEAIAPWWEGRTQFQGWPPGSDAILLSGSAGGVVDGVAEVRVAVDGIGAQFADFRLEAWASTEMNSEFHLLPGQANPLTSLDLGSDPRSLAGRMSLDRLPNADHAILAITATAPDGNRYLLHFWGPYQASFHGTALDWVLAVAGASAP